jgi:hypothetical protein
MYNRKFINDICIFCIIRSSLKVLKHTHHKVFLGLG